MFTELSRTERGRIDELEFASEKMAKKIRNMTGQQYPRIIFKKNMRSAGYLVVDCGENKEKALKMREELMRNSVFSEFIDTYYNKCFVKVENYTRPVKNAFVPAIMLRFDPSDKSQIDKRRQKKNISF